MPDDDALIADDGAAAHGDHESDLDKDKSGDKDVVPKKQFIAAINSAEQKRKAEVAALQAQIDELKAGAAKPAETKRFTRAELRAAVDASQITQEQMDAQVELYAREDAKAEARREATDVVTQDKRKDRVTKDLAQYKRLAPEILEDGHETRQRIQDEFTDLISLGDNPKDLATELKAIRAVLGPIDRLEKARGGRPKTDTHRETGGADDADDGVKTPGGGKLVKTLTAREKAHYSKLIGTQYKDWADVEATLAFANPETRRKHGARV